MKKNKSNRKLKTQTRKKTSLELSETIIAARKHANWYRLAEILSSSTRNQSAINLKKIDSETTEGDTVIIPGKILSTGDLTKKVRLCALSISESAKEKLKTTKSEFSTLLHEIKSNPKAEGIKLLK